MSTHLAPSGTTTAIDRQEQFPSTRPLAATEAAVQLEHAYLKIMRRLHPDWDWTLSPATATAMRASAMRIHHAYVALREPALLALLDAHALNPDGPRLRDTARLPKCAECMFCASTPTAAVAITLRRALSVSKSAPILTGPLCRGCGLTTIAAMSKHLPTNKLPIMTNKLPIVTNRTARSELRALDGRGSLEGKTGSRASGDEVMSLLAKPLSTATHSPGLNSITSRPTSEGSGPAVRSRRGDA